MRPGCAGVMAACFAFRLLRLESSSYAVIKVRVKPNANVGVLYSDHYDVTG
jgi:hypothetical protein